MCYHLSIKPMIPLPMLTPEIFSRELRTKEKNHLLPTKILQENIRSVSGLKNIKKPKDEISLFLLKESVNKQWRDGCSANKLTVIVYRLNIYLLHLNKSYINTQSLKPLFLLFSLPNSMLKIFSLHQSHHQSLTII